MEATRASRTTRKNKSSNKQLELAEDSSGIVTIIKDIPNDTPLRSRRSTKSKKFIKDEDISPTKTRKKKSKTLHCTLCPKKKSFTSKVLFNRHLLKEHGSSKKESIMCEICSAVLTSTKYFKRHMDTRHPQKSKSFICDYCGKSFGHKDYLRIHIDRHRKHQIYTCNVCQKSYISIHTFRRHLRTHLEKHICNICGLIFHQKQLFDNHVVSKHSDDLPFKCQYCTRLFPSKITRNNHQYIAHRDSKTELKFKCDECNIYFEMKEELRIHSFIHFNGDIKTCLECNQIFKTTRLLNIHMQKHGSKKSFQCTECGDFFTFKTGLAKHIRLNRCKGASILEDDKYKINDEEIVEIAKSQFEEITKRKKLVKEEIRDVFKDLEEKEAFKEEEEECLNIKEEYLDDAQEETLWDGGIEALDEYQSVTEEDLKETRKYRKKKLKKYPETTQRMGRAHLVYTCDYCGESIKFRKKIIEHMKEHLKRYNCQFCEENFRSRKKLLEHSIEAHGMKLQVVKGKFSCETCGRKFDCRSTYEAHRLSHDDSVRSQICPTCGAAFKTIGNLHRHQGTHAVSRDFHCDECTKSFKTSLALKVHKEVVHAKLKVFVNCNICNAIVQEKNLNQHIKNVHTEEHQAFECSACGKTFKTLHLGQRHYESVHEPKERGVVYLCDQCPDLTFFRQRDLKEHSFTHYEGPIYQCDDCPKMFKTKRSLIIHRAVHNENIGYRCRICDVIFRTRGGRHKHMRRIHEDVFKDNIEVDDNNEIKTQNFFLVDDRNLRQ